MRAGTLSGHCRLALVATDARRWDMRYFAWMLENFAALERDPMHNQRRPFVLTQACMRDGQQPRRTQINEANTLAHVLPSTSVYAWVA